MEHEFNAVKHILETAMVTDRSYADMKLVMEFCAYELVQFEKAGFEIDEVGRLFVTLENVCDAFGVQIDF